MRFRTLSDVDAFVATIRWGANDEYGPYERGFASIESDLHELIARGEIEGTRSQINVFRWVRRESRLQEILEQNTPTALARRNTIAAEKSSFNSLVALWISVAALLVSVWPYLWFNKAPDITPPPKTTEAAPRR